MGLAIVRALYYGTMGGLQVPADRFTSRLKPRSALALSTFVAAIGFIVMALPSGFAGLCVGTRSCRSRIKRATSTRLGFGDSCLWLRVARGTGDLQFCRRPGKSYPSCNRCSSAAGVALANSRRAYGRSRDSRRHPLCLRLYRMRLRHASIHQEPERRRAESWRFRRAALYRRSRYGNAHGLPSVSSVSHPCAWRIVGDGRSRIGVIVRWWSVWQGELWLARSARRRGLERSCNRNRDGRADRSDMFHADHRDAGIPPAPRHGAERHVVSPVRHGS